MPEATTVPPTVQTVAPGIPGEAKQTTIPVKPEIKPASDAWAAIARKEKALIKDRQAASEREKALLAREAQVKAWEEKKARAKLEPTKWLEEGGISYEDVSQHIIKGGPTTDAKLEAIRLEIERDRKEREKDKERTASEAQKAAEERHQEKLQEFMGQIHSFVESNKEEFDVISLLGAQQMVFNAIDQTARDEGKVPTIKEAAEGVQEFLTGKMEEIIPNLKWFKAKYVAKDVTKVEPEPGVRATETLSNSMTPGTGTNLPAATEADRIKRALEVLDKFS